MDSFRRLEKKLFYFLSLILFVTYILHRTRTGMVQFAAVPREVQPLQQLCRMILRRSFPDWTRTSNLKIPGMLRKYVGYRDLRQEITSDEW